MRDIDWTAPAPCSKSVDLLQCPCPRCEEKFGRVDATVIRLVYGRRGLVPIYENNAALLASGRGGAAELDRLATAVRELDQYDAAIRLITRLPAADAWSIAEDDPVAFARGLPNAAQTAPCVRIDDLWHICTCAVHRPPRDHSLASVATRVLHLLRALRGPTFGGRTDSDERRARVWLGTALDADAAEIVGIEALWLAGLTVEQAWRGLHLARGG